MKKIRVTRYIADCGKGFWKEDICRSHEEVCKCWTNPKNKTCKTCSFGFYAHAEPDVGFAGHYECENKHFVEHTGAPNDINYISVNCKLYSRKFKTS